MAKAAESSGDPGTTSPRPLFAGLSDISISQDIPVEGEITIPMRSHIREFDSSTLNESVQNTIMRDLKAVGKKFMHVLYPRKSNTLLRDWDLWGPLILCVTLALMLQRSSIDSEKDGGPQFAEVFVIVWFGAVTITLNSKLLGGNILYSFSCRQPASKPQSPGHLSRFLVLFCHQLDDSHIHSSVNPEMEIKNQ
ncbi:protein YIPF6 isoform X2 [Ursus arctos]|uniref:protein YIPF6 isoform X2 n=1 Tax=Ursus arctos TaxID=9644 RepID=UPI001CF8D41D|nr:protein YIPF6 isoform X2 [Ursus arctos]